MSVISFIDKLALLRAAMKDKNIDIYIIPSSDPHMGETAPAHWQIIRWLTGFSGSSATVVITESFAGLWTDARYFIQGELELCGSGFSLMRSNHNEKFDFINWLAANVKKHSGIALDGRIFSVEKVRMMTKSVDKKCISIDLSCDLISCLWTDRPQLPYSIAFDHDLCFCGIDRSVKIAEVRKQMKLRNVDYHLLTSADDIMWLLNIRGKDQEFSPVILSFALVSFEQILLFVDETKIPLKLASEFDRLGIIILPYEEVSQIMTILQAGSTILLDPSATSASIFNLIPEKVKIIEDLAIPTCLKAIKNSVEIENICNAMLLDGIALTKFFFWLEHNLNLMPITEISAGKMLESFRAENESYRGPSFATITAFKANGALPHYSADIQSDITITGDGILLIDSGGQYLNGTTDITRTIAVGRPSEKHIRHFTLVLKGMINLAHAVFPYGSKGYQLDFLARKFLAEEGLNYSHGTGHGVGFFLNVHEGPQRIGPMFGSGSKIIIEPGMLISDEPAVYIEGEYGIRIENLILCTENEESGCERLLKFDTLSLCYIEKSLIDISLLDQKEIDWINSYHSEVYDKIGPLVTIEVRNWLRNKTASLCSF